MIRGKKLSVVIPTHNEACSIAAVIAAVPGVADEVLVVDWNSSDGTPAIAAERGARVIDEPRRGYGQAYLSGVEAARGELVVTLDADGTYPAERIGELAETLLEQDLDFISCARFPLHDRRAMDHTNRLGNRALTAMANRLYGLQLVDLLSGMWVFRRQVWQQLGPRSRSWNLCQEIKLKAAAELGPRFAERWIPYGPRQGQSKLIPWRVGAQNLLHLMWFRVIPR